MKAAPRSSARSQELPFNLECQKGTEAATGGVL